MNKYKLTLFILFVLLNFVFSKDLTTKTVLENKFVVITKQIPNTKMVTLNLFINTDILDEEIVGLGYLTHQLLLNPQKKSQIIEKIEREFKLNFTKDYAEISIDISNQYMDISLEFIENIINSPLFEKQEIQKEKEKILKEIQKEKENFLNLAYNAFKSHIYKNHPSCNIKGTEDSIKNITRNDILKYWQKYYVPNKMILVVVGDFSQEDLLSKINNIFKKLKPVEIFESKKYFAIDSNFLPKKIELNENTTKAYIVLGYPIFGILNDDYLILKVVEILLGSQKSKLYMTFCERRKIAYSVGSYFSPQKYLSFFSFHVITRQETLEPCFNGLLDELQKIKEGKFEIEKLTEAKKDLIDAFEQNHKHRIKQAWYLGWFEVLGLGYEFDEKYCELIKKISIQDIQRVTEKYFKIYTSVIVSPK